MAEQVDRVVEEAKKAVLKVTNSHSFDKDEFLNEKLTLSQAFCLLWHDSKTGEVQGRKSSLECNAAATAAALIDLIALGRVEVEIQPKKTLCFKYADILLKVTKDQPTGTYLDNAVFDKMVEHYHKNPEKPKKIKEVIYRDVTQFKASNQTATLTLDSLVFFGILERHDTLTGYSYPIVKPGIQENLVNQIRSVALDYAEPNSYIHALLTVSRLADKLGICTPVLKKYFTKEEYDRARERIDILVGIGRWGFKTDTTEKYQAM